MGEMEAAEPLTTKEGWRRFADRQAIMPGLPAPAVLAAMSRREHDEARRAYHADLPLANTPVIRQVVSTARLLIQLNRHQVSARRGVIVSGPSGTGKTTALTQLGRTHERHVRNRHPATITGCRSST
jgi:flagellar biosynthesis GTPase FlhF